MIHLKFDNPKSLNDILKEIGMFSKDIHYRIKNNQMKLDDVIINKEMLSLEFSSIHSIGQFIENFQGLWKLMHANSAAFYNEDEKGTPIEQLFRDKHDFLNGVFLLKLSKKEYYILKD